MSTENPVFVSKPLSFHERRAFFYEGLISEAVVDRILNALEKFCEMFGITQLQCSSISYVINELCQNIVRYAQPEPDTANSDEALHMGRVMFGQDNNELFVSTAFRLAPEQENDLRKKYQHIRTISTDELEQEYKDIWFHDKRPQINVGMGLLSIARNAAIDARGERRIQLNRTADNLMESTLFIQ